MQPGERLIEGRALRRGEGSGEIWFLLPSQERFRGDLHRAGSFFSPLARFRLVGSAVTLDEFLTKVGDALSELLGSQPTPQSACYIDPAQPHRPPDGTRRFTSSDQCETTTIEGFVLPLVASLTIRKRLPSAEMSNIRKSATV